jgi:hypothetical protein
MSSSGERPRAWVQEREASPSQLADTSEVLELLATLPSPEQTLALCPSAKLQTRMTELLERNRTSGLTPEEREEMRHYEHAEHLVRLAKGRALAMLEVP